MARSAKSYTDISSLSEENKKRLKGVITETAESFKRVDDEKAFQKEVIEDISVELNLDKKLVKKICTTFYKDTFEQDVETFTTFETWYDSLIKD